LEDYTEHHTEKTVHFELALAQEFKNATQLEKALRLRTTISLNNMMLFDADGKIQKYDSPLEIIQDFGRVRLSMYEKRKAHILAKLQRECEILSEKARFIKLVLKGDLKVKKRKIFDLIADLKKNSFKPLKEIKGPSDGDEAEPDDEDKEDDDDDDDSDEDEENEEKKRKKTTRQGVRDFEYLVGMPIITLTMEKIQELTNQRDVKVQERDVLKKKSPKVLWSEDLDALEEALSERNKLRQKEEREERSRIEKAHARAGYKDARRAAADEKEKQREAKRASSAPALTRLKRAKTS